MLFAFGLPYTKPLSVDTIFKIEDNNALTNCRQATVVRDEFAMNMCKFSSAGSLDCKVLLPAVEKYLPIAVALTEQIHKTWNKNMSAPLKFIWTSWLDSSAEERPLPLFEDELTATYSIYGLMLYHCAGAALAGKYSSTALETSTREKNAVALLKRAASVFNFMAGTLIPASLMQSPNRPVELHQASCEALSMFCLAHIQELMIESAINGKKSPATVARLYQGLSDQFAKVQTALNKLHDAYHSLYHPFKVFPRIRGDFCRSMALYYMALSSEAESLHGDAIAYMQGAKHELESIRFPEDNHPTLTQVRNETKAQLKMITSAADTMLKDNQTIYFAIIPALKSMLQPDGIFIPKLDDTFAPIAADSKQYFDM